TGPRPRRRRRRRRPCGRRRRRTPPPRRPLRPRPPPRGARRTARPPSRASAGRPSAIPRSSRALVLAALVLSAGCSGPGRLGGRWWELRQDPSGQAPDAAATSEAVVQVYAARTLGWRGMVGVHTWIALTPTGAPAYTRYEVMGWGVDRGAPTVRINRTGPDNYWFGSRPELLVDRRGEGVDDLIARVEAAVAAYPYPSTYHTWPGPNS